VQPAGPKSQFGAGHDLVGTDMLAGFTSRDPASG
jgi:hypothetical protein